MKISKLQKISQTENEENYCIIIASLDGRVVYFTENTTEIFQCKKEDLLNKYFIELTAPEDIPKSFNLWSELKKGNLDKYFFEKTYISPSGKKIYAKVEVFPIKDINGQIIQAIVKITPNTKIKEFKSEKFPNLEGVIEEIDTPLAIMTRDGTIIYTNKKFLEINNLQKDQIISKKLWSIFSDNLIIEKTIKSFISKQENTLQIKTSIKTTTTPQKRTIKLFRISEERFLVEILESQEKEIYLTLPDFSHLSPKAINNILSSIKISNFKICEGKECIYRSTYQKFAILLHITQDLIVKEIDIPENIFESRVKGNEVIYINSTPLKDEIIFGLPSTEEIEKTLIGKSIKENFKEEAVSCIKQFLSEYYDDISKEFTIDIEETGEKKYFEIRGRKVSDNEYVLIIFNTTPIKKYESLLIKEKEILKREIEEKRKFWSVISHEMRTPLNSILGFIQIIEKSKNIPVEITDYLKAIKISSSTLLNLINDVLEYSKLEEIEQKPELKESILLEDILEVMKSLYPKAKEKNITILPSISPNIPYKVVTDSYRIKRILTNLIDNSIKFSPQNSKVRIDVRVIEDEGIKPQIEIKVKDQGIGIPKDKINNIFKPFYQVDSSLSRKYGGSGLGLSIVKKMVESLEGNIKLESQENIGTTFYITLPLIKQNNITLGDYIKDKITSLDRKVIISKNTLKLCLLRTIKNRTKIFKNLINKIIFIINLPEDLDKLSDGILILNNKELDKNIIQTLSHIRKTNNLTVILIAEEPTKKVSQLYDYIFHPCTSILEIIDIVNQNEQKAEIIQEETLRGIIHKTTPSVMVVEDNPINSMFIQKVLENVGIKPKLCSTSKEVLDTIETENFDIIFMDVQLEGIDGYNLTRIIRSKNLPKQPIIIGLSAQAFQEDIKEGLEAGMNDYLTKPVSIEKIYQTLAKYLAKKIEHIEIKQIQKEYQYISEEAIERIRKISGSQEEFYTFLSSVVKVFKEEFLKEIETIKKLASENNIEEIRKISHRLKGSCYELGLIKLGKTFENIEIKARENINIITVELITEIENTFEETMKELSKILP